MKRVDVFRKVLKIPYYTCKFCIFYFKTQKMCRFLILLSECIVLLETSLGKQLIRLVSNMTVEKLHRVETQTQNQKDTYEVLRNQYPAVHHRQSTETCKSTAGMDFSALCTVMLHCTVVTFNTYRLHLLQKGCCPVSIVSVSVH